jgi:hypothetical protein
MKTVSETDGLLPKIGTEDFTQVSAMWELLYCDYSFGLRRLRKTITIVHAFIYGLFKDCVSSSN